MHALVSLCVRARALIPTRGSARNPGSADEANPPDSTGRAWSRMKIEKSVTAGTKGGSPRVSLNVTKEKNQRPSRTVIFSCRGRTTVPRQGRERGRSRRPMVFLRVGLGTWSVEEIIEEAPQGEGVKGRRHPPKILPQVVSQSVVDQAASGENRSRSTQRDEQRFTAASFVYTYINIL